MDSPRITTFVFDMGGVLMHFDTKIFSHLYVGNDEDAGCIEQALYCNPSWALLDSGTISEATMLRLARARVPERLWEPMERGFAEWEQHQPVLEAMNEQVHRLHETGYGCYLLSNAGVRWWKQKERIPSMKWMDGFVVSAFERLMKPDPIIYQALCERYDIKACECLFVDDNADNCKGAETSGMCAYYYDGNPAKFETYIKEKLHINY